MSISNFTGLFVAPVAAFSLLMGAIGFASFQNDPTVPFVVSQALDYDEELTGDTPDASFTNHQGGFIVKSGENHYFASSDGQVFNIPAEDPVLNEVELTDTVKR